MNDMNQIILDGLISGESNHWITKQGFHACTFYMRNGDNGIFALDTFGSLAEIAAGCRTGDYVRIYGRFDQLIKQTEEGGHKSLTRILVDHIELSRDNGCVKFPFLNEFILEGNYQSMSVISRGCDGVIRSSVLIQVRRCLFSTAGIVRDKTSELRLSVTGDDVGVFRNLTKGRKIRCRGMALSSPRTDRNGAQRQRIGLILNTLECSCD